MTEWEETPPKNPLIRLLNSMIVIPIFCVGFPFAQPAKADTEVDHQIVLNCYVTVLRDGAEPSCVGQAAEKCMYTPPRNSSTLAIMECQSGEADAWFDLVTDHLNPSIIEKLREYEETVSDPAYISKWNRMKEAQDAWLRYRDAQCALLYAEFQDGSMKNIVSSDCKMRMTAARAFEIRSFTWPYLTDDVRLFNQQQIP
ncbi:MAG: lysozyme inhibitor LprI family protein [Paracoccaceae bacterium]